MRAFLAIPVPDQVQGALRILQFLLPLPAAVPPETFHLTLVFLGDLTDGTLQAVHEEMDRLRLPAFGIELAGAGVFGGPRPRAAWAGVRASPALAHLQMKVETAARRGGAVIPARKFVPHVTLGRFAPPLPEEAIRLERAVAGNAGFHAGPFPVRHFTLFASHSGAKGLRYDILAEYPLEGGG